MDFINGHSLIISQRVTDRKYTNAEVISCTSQNEIQKSIHAALEINKATVIAIAHRLSTIKNMDRILVFENGKVIEDGDFKTLMKFNNGKFKELWEHQINGMII